MCSTKGIEITHKHGVPSLNSIPMLPQDLKTPERDLPIFRRCPSYRCVSNGEAHDRATAGVPNAGEQNAFQTTACMLWGRNQYFVLMLMRTSISITGTSMRTPTTVARAAPEERPKSIAAVAMATSK